MNYSFVLQCAHFLSAHLAHASQVSILVVRLVSPHTVNPCACVAMDCNEIIFFYFTVGGGVWHAHSGACQHDKTGEREPMFCVSV